MKTTIYNEEQIDNEMCFAVHFAPTLPFPYERKRKRGVKPFAVVAAICSDKEWSYIHLNSETKEAVGRTMIKHGCDMLKWYWCVAEED